MIDNIARPERPPAVPGLPLAAIVRASLCLA